MILRDAPIGCVPIVWNNAEDRGIAPEVPAATVQDEIARLGYAGTQHGRGFAEGEDLKRDLAARSLRFAELYSALRAGPNGLAEDAAAAAHRDLDRLTAAGGEVLVVAIDGGGEREVWSGRVAAGAPQWSAAAYAQLAGLLGELAARATDGVRVAFHPHTASWVEAPDEVEALAARLPGTGAGLCLDVGHYLVGGGEPARAIRAFGPLVTHVHLKDVDASVLGRLRSGDLGGFGQAVRERIFTELGNGALDLDGVLTTLDAIDYRGWLMVEQDSTWLAPSEAAAVGRRVLDYALRRLDR